MRYRKLIAVVLITALLAGMITGCQLLPTDGPEQTSEQTEPTETKHVETTPEKPEPAETEPEETEPEETEPVETEPEVTEPVETEPEATEPEVTEPAETEPEETEPEETEPEVTEPEETEPEETEPEETEPEETEPVETEPEETEPEETEPEETEPEVTEPEETEPAETEPEETEPTQTEPGEEEPFWKPYFDPELMDCIAFDEEALAWTSWEAIMVVDLDQGTSTELSVTDPEDDIRISLMEDGSGLIAGYQPDPLFFLWEMNGDYVANLTWEDRDAPDILMMYSPVEGDGDIRFLQITIDQYVIWFY